MLEKIDSMILGICTRISHSLQKSFGITNYMIANVGMVMSGSAVFLLVINHFHRILPYETTATDAFIMGSAFVVYVAATMMVARAHDDLMNGNVAKSRFLLHLSTEARFRSLVFFVTPVMMVLGIGVAQGGTPGDILFCVQLILFPLGQSIFYYFMAVDPLPPGARRARNDTVNVGASRAHFCFLSMAKWRNASWLTPAAPLL